MTRLESVRSPAIVLSRWCIFGVTASAFWPGSHSLATTVCSVYRFLRLSVGLTGGHVLQDTRIRLKLTCKLGSGGSIIIIKGSQRPVAMPQRYRGSHLRPPAKGQQAVCAVSDRNTARHTSAGPARRLGGRVLGVGLWRRRSRSNTWRCGCWYTGTTSARCCRCVCPRSSALALQAVRRRGSELQEGEVRGEQKEGV